MEFGIGVNTVLEVVEGMAFDRGYLSHHMVTDVERMQVVLDNPYILMTDHKILSPSELTAVYGLIAKSGRPLLLIADEVAPACIIDMLARRERDKLQGCRHSSAGIRALAQGDAGGHRDHDGRQGRCP